MKKILVALVVALAFPVALLAQSKIAYVDTEYILGKIPNYKAATSQVESLGTKYQKELEDGYKKLDEQYKSYQAEKALLSDNLRKKHEDEIIKRERELKDLQQKYFGPSGEVSKKREELIKPIQDQVAEAIKTFATDGGYTMIFDVAANPSIVYTNTRSDMSDKILEKLGFK